MVSSLSQDRFSRYEGKSSRAKIFMEDCGNTTVAGSAKLLRRFFSKVYTKLTVEGRDEPKGRPPRRATHSGIVCEFSNTDDNDYNTDDNENKGNSALGLDRTNGFSQGHQGYQQKQ